MSILTLLRKCLRAFTWRPLWTRKGRPGVMGVSRARASRASEGFADAEGIHITFDGKPSVQWAEFQTQRSPGKELDANNPMLDVVNAVRQKLFHYPYVPMSEGVDLSTESVWIQRWKDFEGRDRVTAVLVPNKPRDEEAVRACGYIRLDRAFPDTFPEEWTGGQP